MKRNKGGRPKLEVTTEKVVPVRFELKEYNELKKNANNLKYSMSGYIRKLALDGEVISIFSEEENQAKIQLIALTNHVNKLLQLSEINGLATVQEQTSNILQQIRVILDRFHEPTKSKRKMIYEKRDIKKEFKKENSINAQIKTVEPQIKTVETQIKTVETQEPIEPQIKAIEPQVKEVEKKNESILIDRISIKWEKMNEDEKHKQIFLEAFQLYPDIKYERSKHWTQMTWQEQNAYEIEMPRREKENSNTIKQREEWIRTELKEDEKRAQTKRFNNYQNSKKI